MASEIQGLPIPSQLLFLIRVLKWRSHQSRHDPLLRCKLLQEYLNDWHNRLIHDSSVTDYFGLQPLCWIQSIRLKLFQSFYQNRDFGKIFEPEVETGVLLLC